MALPFRRFSLLAIDFMLAEMTTKRWNNGEEDGEVQLCIPARAVSDTGF